MTKLTDTQLILLSTASQRDGGGLLPLPESITAQTERVTKAIATLIKRGLASEAETSVTDRIWRSDGDIGFAALVTIAGRNAIGDNKPAYGDVAPPPPTETLRGSISPRAASKQTKVLELLGRESGASLAELIDATGWLPHTTRAAMTGLRNKGHNIANERDDGGSRYRLVAAK